MSVTSSLSGGVGLWMDMRKTVTAWIPRSGTPVDIPIGDLIGTQLTQWPQGQTPHPFKTPPIVLSQIADQHSPPALSQPRQISMIPATAPDSPRPCPGIPRHCPGIPRHCPGIPHQRSSIPSQLRCIPICVALMAPIRCCKAPRAQRRHL